MTEQERKMLAVSRRHIAAIRARKVEERREADPKHGNGDAPSGWTPAELGERAAARENEIKSLDEKITEATKKAAVAYVKAADELASLNLEVTDWFRRANREIEIEIQDLGTFEKSWMIIKG